MKSFHRFLTEQAQDYYMLFEEKEHDQVWKQYGQKVVQKTLEDIAHPNDSARLPPQEIENDFRYNLLSKKVYPDLHKHPENGKWLISRYATGGIRHYEDIHSRAVPALIDFQKFVDQGKMKRESLSKFRHLHELEAAVNTHRDQEDVGKVEPHEYEVVGENEHWKVVQPKTENAAQVFGHKTNWCTASKKNCAFWNYHAEGPLHIYLPKNPKYRGEKYQRHLSHDAEDSDVYHEKDEPVKLSPFDARPEPDKLAGLRRWHAVSNHKAAENLAMFGPVAFLNSSPSRLYGHFANFSNGNPEVRHAIHVSFGTRLRHLIANTHEDVHAARKELADVYSHPNAPNSLKLHAASRYMELADPSHTLEQSPTLAKLAPVVHELKKDNYNFEHMTFGSVSEHPTKNRLNANLERFHNIVTKHLPHLMDSPDHKMDAVYDVFPLSGLPKLPTTKSPTEATETLSWMDKTMSHPNFTKYLSNYAQKSVVYQFDKILHNHKTAGVLVPEHTKDIESRMDHMLDQEYA